MQPSSSPNTGSSSGQSLENTQNSVNNKGSKEKSSLPSSSLYSIVDPSSGNEGGISSTLSIGASLEEDVSASTSELLDDPIFHDIESSGESDVEIESPDIEKPEGIGLLPNITDPGTAGIKSPDVLKPATESSNRDYADGVTTVVENTMEDTGYMNDETLPLDSPELIRDFQPVVVDNRSDLNLVSQYSFKLELTQSQSDSARSSEKLSESNTGIKDRAKVPHQLNNSSDGSLSVSQRDESSSTDEASSNSQSNKNGSDSTPPDSEGGNKGGGRGGDGRDTGEDSDKAGRDVRTKDGKGRRENEKGNKDSNGGQSNRKDVSTASITNTLPLSDVTSMGNQLLYESLNYDDDSIEEGASEGNVHLNTQCRSSGVKAIDSQQSEISQSGKHKRMFFFFFFFFFLGGGGGGTFCAIAPAPPWHFKLRSTEMILCPLITKISLSHPPFRKITHCENLM